VAPTPPRHPLPLPAGTSKCCEGVPGAAALLPYPLHRGLAHRLRPGQEQGRAHGWQFTRQDHSGSTGSQLARRGHPGENPPFHRTWCPRCSWVSGAWHVHLCGGAVRSVGSPPAICAEGCAYSRNAHLTAATDTLHHTSPACPEPAD
jgi:hypothetical protein